MAKIQHPRIYKYKIKEYLDRLNHAEHVRAKYILQDILKVDKRTFEKYMYTALSDSYEMPVRQLALIAYYFNCRMEDLLNYSPGQIISHHMSGDEELAARLGLTR